MLTSKLWNILVVTKREILPFRANVFNASIYVQRKIIRFSNIHISILFYYRYVMSVYFYRMVAISVKMQTEKR